MCQDDRRLHGPLADDDKLCPLHDGGLQQDYYQPPRYPNVPPQSYFPQPQIQQPQSLFFPPTQPVQQNQQWKQQEQDLSAKLPSNEIVELKRAVEESQQRVQSLQQQMAREAEKSQQQIQSLQTKFAVEMQSLLSSVQQQVQSLQQHIAREAEASQQQIRSLEDRLVILHNNRTFKSSFYKHFYGSTAKPETLQQVIALAKEIVEHYARKHNIDDRKAIERFCENLEMDAATMMRENNGYHEAIAACMAIWTTSRRLLGLEFCSILNEAIREDDFFVMRAVTSLSRAINDVCAPNRSGAKDPGQQLPAGLLQVHRLSALPISERSFFQKHLQYRVPMYLSTSKQKSKCEQFISHCKRTKLPPVEWVIELPQASFHGREVPISYFKEEELLFPPYSVFTVKEVRWAEAGSSDRSKVVLIASADNKSNREELPLASWH